MRSHFVLFLAAGLTTALYSCLMGLFIGLLFPGGLHPDPQAVIFIGAFGGAIILFLWFILWAQFGDSI